MRNRIIDVEDRSEDLNDLLRRDPAFRADFLRKYELTLLHHENALEGVVYSIQELDAALRGVTVAEASVMNGYRDILNHKAALDLVREEARSKKLRVTLALLRKLHEILSNGFDGKDGAAELRKEMP